MSTLNLEIQVFTGTYDEQYGQLKALSVQRGQLATSMMVINWPIENSFAKLKRALNEKYPGWDLKIVSTEDDVVDGIETLRLMIAANLDISKPGRDL